MPLPEPASRQHIHTRRLTCEGYLRDDGLWDIEGHMTDVKTYGFANSHRGEIHAGEPIHDMWLRITVDDQLLIHAVDAVTDAGPFRICPDIAPAYQALVGLHVKPGFTQRVKELLGGVEGCTHLTELLGPIATTAYQTVYASRARKHGPSKPSTEWKRPPPHLNTCHALASDSEVVAEKFPQFYTGARRAG